MQLSKTEREEVVLAKEEKANLRAIKWMAVPYRHPNSSAVAPMRTSCSGEEEAHTRSIDQMALASVDSVWTTAATRRSAAASWIACLRLLRSWTTSLTFTTVDEEDAAKQTSMALHWHTSILWFTLQTWARLYLFKVEQGHIFWPSKSEQKKKILLF